MKTVNNNSIWLPSLLDNLFTENRLDALKNYETFSIPAINIHENLPNFVIELAAPGLKKENITIEAEENILKIASKSVEDNVDNDKTRYTRREFNYKNFERSFKLPENIKIEDINASYESGILRITLPKIEEKKTLKKMVEIS